MKTKLLWTPLLECDVDEQHTCWSAEINHPVHGKFIWLTLGFDGKVFVEACPFCSSYTLAECSSLTSAKRWVSTHLL